MRCGLCTKYLTRKDCYVVPENQRGLVPRNANPWACRACFKRVTGLAPQASDLLAVAENRRWR